MIERLLALHDQQFSEAPMHRCTDAPSGGRRKTTAPIPRRHRRVAVSSPEIGLTKRVCCYFDVSWLVPTSPRNEKSKATRARQANDRAILYRFLTRTQSTSTGENS
jgi:hypothetical protein